MPASSQIPLALIYFRLTGYAFDNGVSAIKTRIIRQVKKCAFDLYFYVEQEKKPFGRVFLHIELFLVEMQEFMTSIIDIIIQASRFSVEKCSNNPQELTKLLKLPG